MDRRRRLGRVVHVEGERWFSGVLRRPRQHDEHAVPQSQVTEVGQEEDQVDSSDPVIWWGKYEGYPISRVPIAYLRWLSNQKWFRRKHKFEELREAVDELLAEYDEAAGADIARSERRIDGQDYD